MSILHNLESPRIWRGDDLLHWSDPELLRVKGPDIPRENIGRMIDPYLIQDKDDTRKWGCFYKQQGVGFFQAHFQLHNTLGQRQRTQLSLSPPMG